MSEKSCYEVELCRKVIQTRVLKILTYNCHEVLLLVQEDKLSVAYCTTIGSIILIMKLYDELLELSFKINSSLFSENVYLTAFNKNNKNSKNKNNNKNMNNNTTKTNQQLDL